MKFLVKLVLGALVVVLLVYAWRHLPGVRTKVTGKVDEYGGWTEEARAADPVGFIEYAEERLREDKASFERSRTRLAESRRNAKQELERTVRLVAAAEELAAEFKQAYRMAEASGSWPVSLRGATYDRDQLVEQVAGILADRATYEKVIGTYTDVIASATERDVELKSRIQSTDATLLELQAQKELARIDQLASAGDELLAEVDALMGSNRSAAAGPAGTPVRSVEELVESTGVDETASRPDALDFLED